MNCRICGAQLPGGAMFCGECGSSSTATPATRKRADPRPGDTTIIQRLPPQPTVISVPISADGPIAERRAAGETAEQAEPAEPAAGEAPQPLPHSADAIAALPADQGPSETAFHLQFSTGESATVSGSGLLGRRPLPQPSETFDHLIQISDPGMSVSKTHLEFGQQDGELWVSDRFSGNGTIIRRPGEAAVRCEPGRRYRVPRGTRVEIADQFFVLG